MTSRRSVLQLIGLSPLAAKAAKDGAIGKLVGCVQSNSPQGSIGSGIAFGTPDPIGGRSSWKAKILKFLVQGKLPDWFEDEIRDRHRYVSFLDPDIASKVSWSMNVKIVEQRRRNIQRAMEAALEGPRRGMRLREFEEEWGVWL